MFENYLSEYAAEFIVEAFSSIDDNILVNEVKRLLIKKWGIQNADDYPPKEILKNVKCRNNSVYLVGEVTEEQKKIFRKFKKEVEDVLKKAELKQTDCLYINRKASQNIA